MFTRMHMRTITSLHTDEVLSVYLCTYVVCIYENEHTDKSETAVPREHEGGRHGRQRPLSRRWIVQR